MLRIFRKNRNKPGAVEDVQLRPAEQSGVDPLEQRLEDTRRQLGARLGALLSGRGATDESLLDEIETTLITSDIGVNAAMEGYSVSGKTGTAQKIDENGQYAEGKYISSFVGMTPSRNPEVVILVVIDEPEKKHYGGVVAAPAFRKIARETLNYLNVPPESSVKPLVISSRYEVSG